MAEPSERGFSLIEAVVAVSLLAVGVASVAQLAIVSGHANVITQQATIAQHAARERMEQLRALSWTSDAGAVPVSDWSTDLTLTPPGIGSPGLSLSPSSALEANTDGYCDFLDANGRWLAGGTRAPADTAFVRRWSIAALDSLPDTLVLQVAVVPIAAANGADRARTINGTWLTTLRSRRTR